MSCKHVDTVEQMIEHLSWHRGKGDCVPDYVFEQLKAETDIRPIDHEALEKEEQAIKIIFKMGGILP